MLFVYLNLCIIAICFRISTGVPLDSFFPFGDNNEDIKLDKGDSNVKWNLALDQDFVFFNISYRKVNILTDGVLIFGSHNYVTYFPEQDIPNTQHQPTIAPFWADFDTTNSGQIYYRVTDNDCVVQKVKNIITDVFQLEPKFTALEVIIVTWDRVGYFEIFYQPDKENTFQCVVATDGSKTYAIFLYSDDGINWTTGDYSESGGGTNGLDGTPATVGFEAGDGVNYLSLEGSRTNAIIDVDDKSNVDYKGLYVFQINDNEIRSPTAIYSPVICKDRIIQSACQILNSTVAELPLPCQQILST